MKRKRVRGGALAAAGGLHTGWASQFMSPGIRGNYGHSGNLRSRARGGALATPGAGLFRVVRNALKSPAIRGVIKNVILGRGQAKKKKRKKGGRYSAIHAHGARGSGVNLGIATGRGLNPPGAGHRPVGFGTRPSGGATPSIADTIASATTAAPAGGDFGGVRTDAGGGGAGQFFRGNVSNSRSGQARRVRVLLPPPSSGSGLRRAGEGLRRPGDGLHGGGQKNILSAFI